jgi:hypothetical protein
MVAVVAVMSKIEPWTCQCPTKLAGLAAGAAELDGLTATYTGVGDAVVADGGAAHPARTAVIATIANSAFLVTVAASRSFAPTAVQGRASLPADVPS